MIKITVMRRSEYPDLMEKYENPIEHACEQVIGKVYYTDGKTIPEGMCHEAWKIMSPFITELANGGGNFFDGWMKDEKSAMVSCNDGFRPVSYYIEVVR